MYGLKCPKHLWMDANAKDKLPPHGAFTEHMFEQGHIVGDYAKKLFSGIDIPSEDFMENIRKTKELLKEKKILFEAGIMANNCFARADVLIPVKDEWDLIEVKSSTHVKEEHLQDVAFQKTVYEQAGLTIRKCFLMHIDNEYVKDGDIDVKQLLKKEDITDEVEAKLTEVPDNINYMMEIINSPKCPSVKLGIDCVKPKECPVDCASLEEGCVFELYRGGKTILELADKGIFVIKDIPEDIELKSNQLIQKNCAINNEIHVDKRKIKEFLANLEYPLSFLDFETFQTAIPIFDGTKPYQQIPFQYSLHCPDHFEYLADGGDCRLEFLKSLQRDLPASGSIVVYNQAFEKKMLKTLAEEFPSYKNWVDSVLVRIIDLLVPFRNFYYYNPLQRGSASMKDVLPALTGKDYSEMEINGQMAGVEYLRIVDGDVSDSEKEKVRSDLLAYCGLDTEGMVWIVEELGKLE